MRLTVPAGARRLAQPGPALLPRVESVPGHAQALSFTLLPGLPLLEAVARPLREAGFAHAVATLEGGGFGPFAYVLPAPSPDAGHAAWYSATQAPPGGAILEQANITFGLREGLPWLHCHAIWQEASGRRAGHVLPEDSIVAAPIAARAWGLSGIGFLAEADPETNFTLFHPVAETPLAPQAGAARVVALRIRPNEDVVTAVEAACLQHGFAAAVLRGSLGSLVGASFAAGDAVTDYATEILVTEGRVAPDHTGRLRAELAIAVADMAGRVHEGALRGMNPVCITFEGLVEEVAAPAPILSRG
jgi:predicted DNA-binding protein with PD1-like motif